MHDHHQVGRAFVDGHTDIAHIHRKPWLRDGDAVLHLYLGDIEIGPDVEADRNRETAVAGRIRRQIDHVLDAVDLLLDRRHHGGRDNIGAGAGILACNGDGGRSNFRILGHR